MLDSKKLKVDKVAIILAGGLGTRVRKLFPNIPKTLIPVFGKPFLHWIILFLKKQEFKNILISTGYKSESVENYIKSAKYDLNIYCIKENRQLGTAGGAMNAFINSPISSDNIFIFNGDSLLLKKNKSFNINDTKNVNAKIWAKFVNHKSGQYGLLDFDKNKKLLSFNEKKMGKGYINAGIYYFSYTQFMKIKEGSSSFEFDIFPEMLDKKIEIIVNCCESPLIDIGTEESLKYASDNIAEHAFDI